MHAVAKHNLASGALPSSHQQFFTAGLLAATTLGTFFAVSFLINNRDRLKLKRLSMISAADSASDEEHGDIDDDDEDQGFDIRDIRRALDGDLEL